MPARMLRTVPQEATEFNQRMGCMAGVFQIFDRRHGLLTARRRGGGDQGARGTAPPGPGHDHLGSSGNASVQKSSTSDITLDKTFSKSMTDNSCLSVESSKASSSSSACSSLSSRDSNKPVKQELIDISKEPSVERPTRNSPSLKLLKIEAGPRSANTGSGDIMQGSVSQDSHDLTVRTSAKEVTNELHKDSPRPLLISKLKNGTYVIGVDRSTSVPAYGRESSRPSRFSCDDRQLLRSVEAQGSKKPSARSRELPRLSLDSRKEYINPSSRPKNVAYTRTDDNLIDALKPQDSPSHRRASSVVAKLMGLEETPRAYEPARSPRTVHDAENDGQSQPHRMVSPDPTVSQLKNQSPVLKTKHFSRILPKAAPWRQQERGATGYNAEEKPPSASFYANIQTRLRDLNLSECNKDLRALRILGALHAEDTACQSETDGGSLPIHKAEAELTANSENFQSPIVIMKPARGITKPDTPPSEPKGFGKLQHEPSFTRKSENMDRKNIHSGNESLHSRGKEPVKDTISPRHSSSLSPRVVLKKADPERMPRLPVPLVSPSKKSNEAVSPRGRQRSKLVPAKNICSDDEVLRIPESKIRLAKQVDLGVIGYPNTMDPKSSFLRRNNSTSALNHEKTSTVQSRNKKKIHPLENIKSPVSVLDGSLYHDGSSPSLRRISDSFKDGETHTSDECLNLTSLPDTPSSKTSSEDKQIKPENMKALIQKLELLQFLSDETLKTNSLLSSVTPNKDQQYIYDIIYASGLLHNELSLNTIPCQLWAASYSINPELFLILEQAKPDTGKLHRMFIFDLANELITKKMDMNQTSRSAQFLPTKKLSGWQIFKDLCAEIDGLLSTASMIRCSEEEEDWSLLAADASSGMKDWKTFDSELLEIVLDIERSIFKDLIDEVISEGASGKVQHRQRKLRRHLSFISI
ncbi:protein LONGIFOLIA 2 [Lolium perenne]|uniref:protein LONGIFOLIA 2 n=1 Tax=Lolium perenne TaxID=4522 RepID=UPI0021F56772|nr:protein LONGIFOLIA 1-like [Lolium perenne]